ncbi:ArdC family protein [Sphingomonas sp. UYP23]
MGAGAGAGSLPAAAPRASLYDEVTARIVAELEAGRVPWVQPWGATGAPGCLGGTAPGGTGQGSDDAQHRWNAGVGLPRNALTARSYSGINVLMLWGAVIEQGYPSQAWLTFKQAITAGGAVRKGERGTTIVYADRFVPRQQRDAAVRGIASPGSGDTAKPLETGESASTVAFLKRFTVFNVAQCEGLRRGLAPEPVPLPEREIVPVAEDVIAASGVTFHVGGDQAFYMPSRDVVQVPPQPVFHDQINFYRTVLHELTHNAAIRIMPHGLCWRLDSPALAMRLFGIIRALPRTRAGYHQAGTGLTAWLAQQRERAPFLSSACRHGCRSGWSRRSHDPARARSPLDRRRGGEGPSPCCGAAYVA